jgi:methylated-DNA-[protein]-cysteine S-methyltransferase
MAQYKNQLATSFVTMHSPIGYLRLDGDEMGVASIFFKEADEGASEFVPQCLVDCRVQLEEYFAGKRKVFDLLLRPLGTDFQLSVWNALLSIPFGVTRSYKDVALALKKEKAVRAVGAANGQNPLSVVIPCHRVIGSNGALTGYGGELWRKEWLLAHERNLEYGTQGSLF